MKLVTPKIQAAEAAERWKKQYCHGDKWGHFACDAKGVYDRLRALGSAPEPDDVDHIIGNRSWTRVACDECKNNVAEVCVILGQEPDYESSTASICVQCLKDAVAMCQ